MEYFAQVEASSHLSGLQADVANLKRPAEMLATMAPTFAGLFGAATEITNIGMNVDVRRYVLSVASRVGDRNAEKSFVTVSGMNGSGFEHAIFESLQNAPAVSAAKLLALANSQGVPIYAINASNLSQILPRLTVSSAELSDITNAVSSGKRVIVPQDPVSFKDWSGSGYIVLDPETGAAAYLITGGLAGGATSGDFNWKEALEALLQLAKYKANSLAQVLGSGKLGNFFKDNIVPAASRALTLFNAISAAIRVTLDTHSLARDCRQQGLTL